MHSDDDTRTPPLGTVIVDNALNVALAFGAICGLNAALETLGVDPATVMGFDLPMYFAILFADPVGSCRQSRSRRDFGVKLGLGMTLGWLVSAVATYSFMGGGAENAVAAPTPFGETTATDQDGGLGWTVLVLLLIGPIAFLASALERILKGGGDDAPVTVEKMQVSSVFPVFLSVTFALILAIPGALWLLDASVALGLVVWAAGALSAVTETWLADPEDLIDDLETTAWQDRPVTAAEAFAGLRKAIAQNFASALFFGGMIYVALQATIPVFPEMNPTETGVIAFLLGFLPVMGVMLIAMLGLLGVGGILAATSAILIARHHRLDIAATEAFVNQATGRLFMGGVEWVRPDLEDD